MTNQPSTFLSTSDRPRSLQPGQPAGSRSPRLIGTARRLVQLRDNWLNPPDISAANLKQRALTNLYNQRPGWLDLAHQRLDRAVLDAYGWPHTLTDDEVLARLLALNLARAGRQAALPLPPVDAEDG